MLNVEVNAEVKVGIQNFLQHSALSIQHFLPLLHPHPPPVDSKLGQHPRDVCDHRFGTADEAERRGVVDEGAELVERDPAARAVPGLGGFARHVQADVEAAIGRRAISPSSGR